MVNYASTLIIAIGMLGGVVAQTPIICALRIYNWKTVLHFDIYIGVTVLLLILIFVYDTPYPKKYNLKEQNATTPIRTIKKIYICKHNLSCGIFTSLLNVPTIILGALWGITFLTHSFSISIKTASFITSLLFIGTLVGSPLLGYISSKPGHRKLIMTLGALMSLACSLIIIFFRGSYEKEAGLFFLLGLLTSVQTFGYSTAAERHPQKYSAMSASTVSFLTMSGYIIFQPLFGFILDVGSKYRTLLDFTINTSNSYKIAILLIPISLTISISMIIFIKEPKYKNHRI